MPPVELIEGLCVGTEQGRIPVPEFLRVITCDEHEKVKMRRHETIRQRSTMLCRVKTILLEKKAMVFTSAKKCRIIVRAVVEVVECVGVSFHDWNGDVWEKRKASRVKERTARNVWSASYANCRLLRRLSALTSYAGCCLLRQRILPHVGMVILRQTSLPVAVQTPPKYVPCAVQLFF